MKALLLTLIVTGLVLVSGAQACTCVPPGTPSEELVHTDMIFAGTVIELEKMVLDGNLKATFLVHTVWKGVEDRLITIATSGSEEACGFPFEQGKAYLVYADGVTDFSTSSCSRTALLGTAQLDLEELGQGTQFDAPEETSPFGINADSLVPLLLGVVIIVVILAIIAGVVIKKRGIILPNISPHLKHQTMNL
ncbi:MAG: hypothetical protein KKA90_02880 [Nanoarchaeota archaeon]|nr:hypothetical protein [Nanoarchaeota archaeon]